jgi:diguanylate cyclase (GGDEF)-like protein
LRLCAVALLPDPSTGRIWRMQVDGTAVRVDAIDGSDVVERTIADPTSPALRGLLEFEVGAMDRSLVARLDGADTNAGLIAVTGRHPTAGAISHAERVLFDAVATQAGMILQFDRLGRALADMADSERQLLHAVHHDPLTGIANRRLFEERLARAARSDARAWVCVIDLDGFKPLNDSLGHLAGDQALQAIAERLTAVTREPDCIARLGGDEFAGLIIGCPDDRAALSLAERMLEVIRQPIPVSAGVAELSASVGIARLQVGTDPAAALAAADEAMYSAKVRGKGAVAAAWG